MKSFAILIDGGFVKANLGTPDDPLSANDVKGLVDEICLSSKLATQDLHRVYFYDAPPFSGTREVPLNGGERNFSQDHLTEHNRRLHVDLKKADYFALRMGKLGFRGWGLKSSVLNRNTDSVEITAADLSPLIRQKGVDMRVGLDIATLAFKKQVDTIVLVTSDSDFVPAMKLARREGVQFVLTTLGHSAHPDLVEHADLFLDDIAFPRTED